MFIEPGDRIRFRVAEEIFEDSKPKMGGEIQDKVIPYKIIAAIDDDGLGPVSWWNWKKKFYGFYFRMIIRNGSKWISLISKRTRVSITTAVGGYSKDAHDSYSYYMIDKVWKQPPRSSEIK